MTSHRLTYLAAPSGLRHAIEVLNEVDDISFNFFQADDVVRHPVVARIVNAYEKWEAQDQKERKEFENAVVKNVMPNC